MFKKLSCLAKLTCFNSSDQNFYFFFLVIKPPLLKFATQAAPPRRVSSKQAMESFDEEAEMAFIEAKIGETQDPGSLEAYWWGSPYNNVYIYIYNI